MPCRVEDHVKSLAETRRKRPVIVWSALHRGLGLLFLVMSLLGAFQAQAQNQNQNQNSATVTIGYLGLERPAALEPLSVLDPVLDDEGVQARAWRSLITIPPDSFWARSSFSSRRSLPLKTRSLRACSGLSGRAPTGSSAVCRERR